MTREGRDSRSSGSSSKGHDELRWVPSNANLTRLRRQPG